MQLKTRAAFWPKPLIILGFVLLFAWGFGLFAPSPVVSRPSFELRDLNGKVHRLSDYRGKWVLVNYWATWCLPCLEEMPELETFYIEHKDKDAVVIGINFDTNANLEKLHDFAKKQFISFPLLRGFPDQPGIAGPIEGLPISYLIEPEGHLVGRHVGKVTHESIENFIYSYNGY